MKLHCGLLLATMPMLLFGGGASAPATKKWEGPRVKTPFGSTQVTLYYGPWRCRSVWLTECQKKCAAASRSFMGCMWVLDVKVDGQSQVPFLTFTQVRSGGRYAVTHCCCDYPKGPVEVTERLRKEWSRQRDNFRDEWSKRMGSWPTEATGKAWPGHHVHDLAHGGAPTAESNIWPVPDDIHDELNKQYPLCYEGKGGWNQAGQDHPYVD